MIRISKVFTVIPKNFTIKQTLDRSIRCLATQTAAAVKSARAEKVEEVEKVEKKSRESRSFVMNIFHGQLETSEVFPFPEPLTEDEMETVKMLVDPMEKFYKEVNDPMKNDENASIDEKTMKGLWELGAFYLQVPQDFGGLELNNTQYTRCVEICGANDLGIGTTLGAHQGIGFKAILLLGTPEQKAKYLPRACNGEIAAFCLTEPSCGSDASAVRCRAVKSPDGSHYILNGSKIWISNGGLANIMTVFAQVPFTNPETGETKDKMTAFIVERSFGGVTSGPPEKKMGIKCSNTAEIYFEDVKIPVENVLGEEGQGFKIAMNVLNNGRFAMAAALAGTMRYCIKKAVDHATQRVQFGRTIDNYGTIQEKIGRMSLLQYITESLAYVISGNMDKGSQDYHLETAISKCFASESAWWVCDETIQVLGGMGFMKDAGLERVMRDLRVFKIFEGSNDVLRLFIALTGIQYAGSHLKELQKALKNPAYNLGVIVEEAAKRATRAIGLNSPPTFTHLVHPSLAESSVLCAKGIETFGQTVETCLVKYGRGIVDEQFLLHRISQAAFDIYTMSVILSRASMSASKNLPSAQHELLMAQTWCAEASSRVAWNLKVANSPKHMDVFSKLSKISRNTCEAGGPVQTNPLGF